MKTKKHLFWRGTLLAPSGDTNLWSRILRQQLLSARSARQSNLCDMFLYFVPIKEIFFITLTFYLHTGIFWNSLFVPKGQGYICSINLRWTSKYRFPLYTD